MVENAPDNIPTHEEPSPPAPETEEERLQRSEREAFQRYVEGMKEIRKAIMKKARQRCDVVRRGDVKIAKKIIAAESSLAMVLGEDEEADYLWSLLSAVETAGIERSKAKQALYEHRFGVPDILPKG